MSPYRIAMLQCELGERHECHSYHFAPFMDDCDPKILKKVWPTSYYYHTHPQAEDQWHRIERIDGLEVVSVWDIQGRERAQMFSNYVRRRPRVCDSIEEAIENVDAVFLADGGGDGSRHLQWVAPILKKGLPVYIDKPFSDTWVQGKAIIDLAKQTDTPFFATSILRYVPEVDHFKASWQRLIDPPGLAVVKGCGPSNGATIHGLSLMQSLFGTGVESVECMGSMPREIMNIRYKDGLQVIVLNTQSSTYDWFRCEVWSKTKRTNPPGPMYAQSQPIGDVDFIPGAATIIRHFKQMIETRKPPESYEVPLELATVLEAGLLSQETHRPVCLTDIME